MQNINANAVKIVPTPAQQAAAGDIRKFFHGLNNHLAIVEAFFSMVDTSTLDDDMHQLYNNARRSFTGIREMMR